MSVLSYLLLLMGLCSISSCINFNNMPFVKMADVKLLNTEPSILDTSACHCKMLCFARPSCIGVTFISAENKCGLTATDNAGGVVLEDAGGHTTWLKHDFAYTASKVLEMGPSFFLTSTTTNRVKLGDLTVLCAAEGGTPANIRTDGQKEEFLRVMAGGDKAWVPVTHREGVLVWQDEAPVSTSAWITVGANDVSSPLHNGALATDGTLYMKDKMSRFYPILCARPPSTFRAE